MKDYMKYMKYILIFISIIMLIACLYFVYKSIYSSQENYQNEETNYKLGLLMPIYNRSEIGTRVLDRLSQCTFPKNTVILLLDDGSTEKEIVNKIKSVEFPSHVHVEKQFQNHNKDNSYHNIGKNIKKGFNYLIDQGCDYVMNLDDDMLVKKDFIIKLMDLANEVDIKNNGGFITGFLETSNVNAGKKNFYEKNRDLYDKLKSNKYIMRSCGGGCNHLMTKESYLNIYKPGLIEAIENNKKWDVVVGSHIGKLRKNNDTHGIWYSPANGVMQHLGFNGLNKFVWDFNYDADDDDKRIFKELNIENKKKF